MLTQNPDGGGPRPPVLSIRISGPTAGSADAISHWQATLTKLVTRIRMYFLRNYRHWPEPCLCVVSQNFPDKTCAISIQSTKKS